MSINDKLKKLDEINRLAEIGGGKARIEKHHKAGKLTARERINVLLDPDSFVEIDKFIKIKIKMTYYIDQ